MKLGFLQTRSSRFRSLTVLVTGIIAVLALALGACSAPKSDDDKAAGGPVIVNLPTGEQVTFKSVPKRIVTLGITWTDVALKLGVTPVAYLDEMSISTQEDAPWLIGKLPKSQKLTSMDGLSTAIAKLNPDLILAPAFATAQAEPLKKLGVPVITQVDPGQQVDPWQKMTEVLGQILRKPKQAQEVTADVDAKVAAVARKYPKLKGKTYSFVNFYEANQLVVVANPDDGGALMFKELGLDIVPKFVAEYKKTGNARITISAERVPDLNSDVLFILVPNSDMEKRLTKLPGYNRLTSVRTGAVTVLTMAQGFALNTPSPSSLEYALSGIEPALQKANDAATA